MTRKPPTISQRMNSARGRVAAESRAHPEGSEQLLAARQELNFCKLSEYVARAVTEEPRFTHEQIQAVARILLGGGDPE